MSQKPETNLELIERNAKKRERENLSFRQFLKAQSSSTKIDQKVFALYAEVSNAIDCTTCGNCCKQLNPAIEEHNKPAIAAYLNCSVETLETKHLDIDPVENYEFIKTNPCPCLDNNKCMIYQDRPASCAEYPHLNKKDFVYRLFSVLDNYGICPIVYNVVERLKQSYHFKY
ncbi:MAG: YkgJ family cysteine cluster protein [Bacteroidetes bacterium]|nr:YkgJ family cysteine cluster protein [Bacteroidota bacterium]